MFKVFTDLATSVAGKLSGPMSAVGGILNFFNVFQLLPGVELEKREVDAALLNRMLIAFQTGGVSLVLTHEDDKRTGATIMRIKPMSASGANTMTGTQQFVSAVLHGKDPARPNIQVLVNNTNLAANYHRITSDVIVAALIVPAMRIPKVGPMIAGMMADPAKKLADYLVRYIGEQGVKAASAVANLRKRPDTADKPLPPGPQ